MRLTTAEHDEAFHDGMEAAYGNLRELLDRLEPGYLNVWSEGSRMVAYVQGIVWAKLPTPAPPEAWIARFEAARIDELLGQVEDWCNEWLPTGQEVAL